MSKFHLKLNFILVCETAFSSQEGNLNIIGIFENILAPKFPAVHPKMAIVFNVEADIGKYNFKVTIIDDDKQKVMVPSLSGDFIVNNQNGKFGFIGNIINIKFEHEGVYSVNLDIDGHRVGITKFKVGKLLMI